MVDYDEHIANTIEILTLAEVNLMEISEMDRKISLDLEIKMTEAANRDDSQQFFKLLDDWRCMLMRGWEGEQFFQRKAA